MKYPKYLGGTATFATCAIAAGMLCTPAGALQPDRAQSPASSGGILTIASNSTPTSLNPLLNGNNADELLFNDLAYEPLIHLSSTGQYQPGLAISWKYANGLKQFDLTLRSGVKFSDGSPLTAKGVAQSINAFRQAGGSYITYASVIKSVVAAGPLTVQITLNAPDPVVPLILSEHIPVGDIVSPKGLLNQKSLSTTTDGAGPYMLDPAATVAGSSYTYVPNPYYYDKSAVHFSKVIISVIGDASTALNALKSGQIAYADGSFTSADSAVSSGLAVHAAPTAWSGIYLFDRNGALAKPLGNLLVRQALNYATNRAAVTATIFGKYGAPTAEISLPQYSASGYVPSWNNHYSYNVATAKALLAKAGYPHGFTLEMAASNDWGDGVNIAQAIASEWSQVGVNVQIKSFPALTQMLGPWQAAQLPSLAGSYYPVPMYVEAQQILVKTAGLFNPWKVSDPGLSALITKADDANSVASSAHDWAAVEESVINLAWFVPIARTDLIYFSQPWLHGVNVQANCCPNPTEFYKAG